MTNKEIGLRIKETRLSKNETMDSIAAKIGVAKSTIQRYESGKIEKIKIPVIESIANALNVDPAWLIGKSSTQNAGKEIPRDCLPLPKMRKWTVLGSVACGEPIHREADDEYIAAPDDIDADYVFRCIGDSMNGAHIFDGDIVFIKHGVEVPDGAIGLVRVEDEYMLKRVFHRHDCLELRSDNPAYPPRYITGEQINAEIVGKAVRFITIAV